MTAYATVADVAALYPAAATDAERTTALLDQGAALMDAYAPGLPLMDPAPAYARTINVNMVVRAMVNPLGVKSEQLASYSTTWGDTRVGLYLTDDEMAALANLPGAQVRGRVYDIRTPAASEVYGETYWEPGAWYVMRGGGPVSRRGTASPALPPGRVYRR